MRLATFNILHGKSPTDGKVDLDRFAAAVRTIDADVLALQEVDRGQPRSHGADLAAIAADAMGGCEHRFVGTLMGTPTRWSVATGQQPPAGPSYGIALLSRHPVRWWGTLPLPMLPGRVPVLLAGSRGVTLVRDEQRAALAAVLDTPEGPLSVVTTHLTLVPGWNTHQLRRLVRLARDLPRPLVVLGDLNLEGGSPARATGMRALATSLTFPSAAPVRQIDHILGDGPIRATSDAVGLDPGMSDHRALVVEVELDAPPTARRARR